MTKRLNNISLLRMMAILMIFIHHVICGFFADAHMGVMYFPSSMGVEIFLFVSAYLYGNKNITNFKQFFAKRAIYIFLPYYIFLFILLIFYAFYNPNLITVWEMLQGIFCLYVFDSSFHSLRHFWFLPIIMLCYLFIPLLQKFYNSNGNIKKILKIIFFGIIGLEIAMAFIIHSHLMLTSFFIGYYFAKMKDYKTISLKASIPSFLAIEGMYVLVRGGGGAY